MKTSPIQWEKKDSVPKASAGFTRSCLTRRILTGSPKKPGRGAIHQLCNPFQEGGQFQKISTVTFALHFVSEVGLQWCIAWGFKLRLVSLGPMFNTHDSVLLYAYWNGTFRTDNQFAHF